MNIFSLSCCEFGLVVSISAVSTVWKDSCVEWDVKLRSVNLTYGAFGQPSSIVQDIEMPFTWYDRAMLCALSLR